MGARTLSEFADAVDGMMPFIVREFFRREGNSFLKTRITMPQFFVLLHLSKYEKSSMSDVASVLGVTTAAMTGVVDRLVRDELMFREHNKEDRRVVNIKLTAKGVATIKSLLRERKQFIMEIFGTLTQQERDQYLRILFRIRDALTHPLSA